MIKTGYNILIVGDVMLDEYIIGHHRRMSPEAPVAVINHESTEYRLGGAANVARNLVSLGCKATLVGITGEDNSASILLDACTYSGIRAHFVIDRARPTTRKTRVVDHDFKQFLRIDKEETQSLSDQTTEALKNKINALIQEGRFDAIIVQDYNKGCIDLAVIDFLFSDSQVAQLPLIVDPKHKHYPELSKASIFKPNLLELSAFVGHQVKPEKVAIDEAVKELKLPENAYIFVTLAENGIYYKYHEQSAIIPGSEVKNADVSGAGDTVISALTLAYLNSLNAEKMALLANQCGAYVCAQKGIAQIPIAEVRKMAKMLDL